MTVTTMARTLETQLQNPVSFTAISTRVLLRTGVNLRKPNARQDGDGPCIEKVRLALAEMGYQV